MHQIPYPSSMTAVCLESTTIGVNLLAHTRDLTIFFMRTTSSHKSKRGIPVFICNYYNATNKKLVLIWCSNRCNLKPLVVEVDRILRPEGYLIVRDDEEIISELETLFRSMQWEVRLIFSKNKEGFLCVQKSLWRPSESETVSYAIA